MATTHKYPDSVPAENKPEKRLLLLGGGGHAHSVLDSAAASGIYAEISYIYNDDAAPDYGAERVGCDDDLPRLHEEGWNCAFVTVGSIGSTRVRRRLYDLLRNIGFEIPVIADPTAVVAGHTSIGEGTYIGKRAVVNAGARIGTCAILNTGSVIEHDCIVGDFAHISPGTTLCGHVTVGHDAHVGAGSVVRQEISIGDGALVGAGSVVVSDIPPNTKAYGNPCRVRQD